MDGAEARVEHAGDRHAVETFRGLSPAQVSELIAHLQGQEDTTVRLGCIDQAGEMLVAISGSNAFVGLAEPNAVFQYVGEGEPGSTVRFQIGGQDTDVDAQYVVTLGVAADVAAAWVQTGRGAAGEAWEQR